MGVIGDDRSLRPRLRLLDSAGDMYEELVEELIEGARLLESFVRIEAAELFFLREKRPMVVDCRF